ncbi:hypothetical protein [Chryseobacterium sp.]|uniref:hypothetical protein n=1 Tax=Chryseobacterium sp. TaxID=1871047 RepID=UPI0025C31837|nr:hypothetical protein [Chryseobacterium sp.]
MKKLLFLLLFIFSFNFGQTKEFPLKDKDFSAVILNKEMLFEGVISTGIPFKFRFKQVIKNPEKPDIYLVSGTSETEGKQTDFLGELNFTEKYDVKNTPSEMLLFGNFFLVENGKNEHSGMFKGKFRIQTHKDVAAKENFSTLTFKGTWRNYSKTLDYKVWWANFNPSNIEKVIFK